MTPRKFQFTIPLRVRSKKNSKQIVQTRYGQTFLVSSKAYRNFESEVIDLLTKQTTGKNLPLKPPYAVSYVFRMKGNGATDLDNMISSVNDIMQKLGIIDDDKNIMKHLEPTEKVIGADSYEAIITVEEMVIEVDRSHQNRKSAK